MKTGILLITVVFAISSCGLSYIDIADIKARPEKYQDKQVSIKGRVVETLSVPFIQKGMYQVDDGSDKIWVISQKRAPLRGENLTVKGKVKTGFAISERTFGTVVAEGE